MVHESDWRVRIGRVLEIMDGGEMADIQHQDARKLLDIISSVFVENGNRLTYWEGASRMGRVPPDKHSRAVAQVCDLLDAAACVAGVPLLALVAVREKSGEINPKAWKNEYGPRRDAIIKRSLDHHFLREDLEAISNALDDLGERGNTKAWAHVKSLYPGDCYIRGLSQTMQAQYQVPSMTSSGRIARIAHSQKLGRTPVTQKCTRPS
jgi:hypothetical protein